ncbi:MAG TPA: hypothetical protein VEY12_01355 [Thermoplasmata archaeon]|nr:hypothetical protein [Thermoplasmata archaeon]
MSSQGMTKGMGVVALVLGVILSLVGLDLGWTCTAGSFGVCINYGYQGLGTLIAVVGLLLAIIGIVLVGTESPRLRALMRMVPPHSVFPPQSVYSPPPATYGPPPQPVQPAIVQVPPQPSGLKFCPVCGNHYPSEYHVCPRDSAPLRLVQ